jgi:hypothetical protein
MAGKSKKRAKPFANEAREIRIAAPFWGGEAVEKLGLTKSRSNLLNRLNRL